jgi:hypothetical protein
MEYVEGIYSMFNMGVGSMLYNLIMNLIYHRGIEGEIENGSVIDDMGFVKYMDNILNIDSVIEDRTRMELALRYE